MNRELLQLLRDVAFAVLPISLVVCGLQFALLHMPGEVFARFLMGALFVGGGLFLFLFGVNTGLLPMGEMIGAELPNRGSVVFLLFMSFVLGVTITVMANSREQLDDLYRALSTHPMAKWVL